MDDLDLLKRDWNKETSSEFKHYSKEELFLMTKQESISITKTLLLIGGIEISLWGILLYIETTYYDLYFGWKYLIRVPIFILFIGLLFYNLSKIKNKECSRKLMKRILLLRKIIIYYIFFIIGSIIAFNIIDFEHHTHDFIKGFTDGFNEGVKEEDKIGKIDIRIGYILFSTTFFVAISLLLLIYKSTYGKLLKKLKENYNELNKLENTKNID